MGRTFPPKEIINFETDLRAVGHWIRANRWIGAAGGRVYLQRRECSQGVAPGPATGEKLNQEGLGQEV